ncbi:hypothetical protein OFY17_02620 [Marinomonas sp. C2222]|uniref:Phage protein n=1 Tax=Marinomonas sargassi TaxID=2984494 RepID=A0ABT2YPE4_9GAMM|nr:hypothetical protein [Marinomonas sargassi]MCV2401770.1 hypothetical protein [Marinomonas sargassi]
MKTSEFLVKLKKLDASVPFDAELVIGDDWMPQRVTGLYHEPPHTFIKVESPEVYDEEDFITREEQKATRAGVMMALHEAKKIAENSTCDASIQRARTIIAWLEPILK